MFNAGSIVLLSSIAATTRFATSVGVHLPELRRTIYYLQQHLQKGPAQSLRLVTQNEKIQMILQGYLPWRQKKFSLNILHVNHSTSNHSENDNLKF